jgi:hypothetical protein
LAQGFDCVDNHQTVERPDARRCPDDTRRGQPNRWPNGIAESNVSELRGKKIDDTPAKNHPRGVMRALNYGKPDPALTSRRKRAKAYTLF